MIKRIFLALTLCIFSASTFGTVFREHIWFGEQLFYADESANLDYTYTPQFYIYNVGTHKFLTDVDGTMVAPGAGTPTLFSFTPYDLDNNIWFIKNPAGNYLRLWYQGLGMALGDYNASADYNPTAHSFPSGDNFKYALATVLVEDGCGDSQAKGHVLKFGGNQTLGTNWYMSANDDGSLTAQRINGSFNLTHDNTTEDKAKFLLISPQQYQMEIARQARMADFEIDEHQVAVDDYMLNTTIVQTQGTPILAPFGWNLRNLTSDNGRITKVADSGATPLARINTDTYLECWTSGPHPFEFDYYQTVTLPAGNYRLSADIFVDGLPNIAGLYVKAEGVEESMTVSVTGRTPNRYTLDFSLNVETDVDLGVRSDGLDNRQSWIGVDNFGLMFLSNTEPTSPEAYWYGEPLVAGQLDGEDRYYLYNLGTELYINDDVNNPGTLYVDDTAETPTLKALKYSFASTSEGKISHQLSTNQYLYLQMRYQVVNWKGVYTSYLSTTSRDQALAYATTLEISGPSANKRGGYQFKSGIINYHAFGVDKDNLTYKSWEETDDDCAWWLAISEVQYEAYLDYVATYKEGLHILQTPDEWPLLTKYRNELIKWMNTPAQYIPANETDNVTPHLKDLIARIKAELDKDDPGSTEVGRFGTRCLYYDFDVTGANLYTVEGLNGAVLVLSEAPSGLAGEAYIYQATESEQHFPNMNTGYADEPGHANRYLHGVYSDTDFPNLSRVVPVGCYVLQTKEDEKGNKVQKFYKVTKANSRSTAYRCYLLVNAEEEAAQETDVKGVGLTMGNETDALKEVFGIGEDKAPVIYDIEGRRIPTLQRGINIVNGYKVLVK